MNKTISWHTYSNLNITTSVGNLKCWVFYSPRCSLWSVVIRDNCGKGLSRNDHYIDLKSAVAVALDELEWGIQNNAIWHEDCWHERCINCVNLPKEN